jgi:CRP-like cAMP-binding protein
MYSDSSDNDSPFMAKKSIFRYLSPEEKEELENHMERVIIRKNQLIFEEGEMPKAFITLEQGKVKIFKGGVGGREQILRMVKPGGFVSYRALIAGEVHISSAVALEESNICVIEKDYFFEKLLKNSALSLRIITKLAKELGFSNSRTVNLTQKHIRGRLAESIILLAHKYGFEPDGSTIKAYLSREDLASLSNMTTSNAIRTLSGFVSEKVIAIDGRKLKLLDYNKLDRISMLG